MTRPIKFRVWDKEKKEMLYANKFIETNVEAPFLTILGDVFSHEKTEGGCESRDENERFELMQYTGLKDKNGVEIYEGDLLKETKQGFLGMVYFCDLDLGFKFIYMNGIKVKDWLVMFQYEIIGNIYQNHE